MHTSPVSRCAVANVFETVTFYKEAGYDGIFITNHFLDGNINIDAAVPYEEKIAFYASDYEEAAVSRHADHQIHFLRKANQAAFIGRQRPGYHAKARKYLLNLRIAHGVKLRRG